MVMNELFWLGVVWVVGIALLAWWRLEMAIVVLLATVPIFLIRLSIFGVPTTLLELGIYACAGVWGMRHLPTKHWRPLFSMFRGMFSGVRVPLGLWLSWTVFSALFAPDLQTSFGILKGWFVDPLLLLLMVADLLSAARLTSVRIILSLGIGAVAVGGFGLVDLWSEIGKIKIPGRLDSFYESANYVSLYLGPILVLWLGMLFGRWKILSWLKRGMILGGMAVMGVALLFTQSFGGWMSAGFASVFLIGVFAIHIERIRWMGGVGLLVLVLATGGYAATQGFSHYNERFQISSLDTRRDLWIGAWGLIQEQPILGQGLGAFRGAYPAYVNAHPQDFPYYVDLYNALWPHQLYLAIWVESGGLALFGFLWLIVAWARRQGQAYWKGREWIFAASLAAMLAIFLHGWVDTPYFKNDLSVLFWIVFLLPLIVPSEQIRATS